MAGPRVYYDLMSQPSRAVMLFLKLTKIPYIDNVLALRKGEHLTEQYGKINPLHLVPAIDDDGFILTESIAIIKYLHAKYGSADHWYPADLQKRAMVDQYLSWYHLNTRIKSAMVFRAKVIEPRAKNIPVDQERLRMYETELDISMDQLENIYLKDRDYLAGDDITIADIMGICEVMQPHACGYPIYEGRPKVTAWMERVRRRLNPQFDEVHVQLQRVFKAFGTAAKM